MAELTPPILIDERGDISLYVSSERAASHVEAIDVLNGEYEFFDAAGRRLLATVDRNRVGLEIDPTRPPEPESLERRLRGYFAGLPDRLDGHRTAAEQAQTLAELVELRAKMGRGPRP
jgi:hypothetical protein